MTAARDGVIDIARSLVRPPRQLAKNFRSERFELRRSGDKRPANSGAHFKTTFRAGR